MGDIVEFRESRCARKATVVDVPAEGAQILFFLGVRYERHEEAAPRRPARKRTGRAAGGKRKSTRKRA